jgi:hypothetical protein
MQGRSTAHPGCGPSLIRATPSRIPCLRWCRPPRHRRSPDKQSASGKPLHPGNPCRAVPRPIPDAAGALSGLRPRESLAYDGVALPGSAVARISKAHPGNPCIQASHAGPFHGPSRMRPEPYPGHPSRIPCPRWCRPSRQRRSPDKQSASGEPLHPGKPCRAVPRPIPDAAGALYGLRPGDDGVTYAFAYLLIVVKVSVVLTFLSRWCLLQIGDGLFQILQQQIGHITGKPFANDQP